MTRVFHVVECGDLTGCGKMVAAIANRLPPEIFETALVYAVRPGTAPEEYEKLLNENIRRLYMPRMVRRPSPVNDLAALFGLYALFKKERPDAVHLHSSKAGFLGRLAAFAAGVPRVFYSPYGYSFRMTDAGFAARGLYYLLEMAASVSGYIVATAPCEKATALNFAPESRVIEGYNGIDVRNFEPVYPREDVSGLEVVACGRITSAKNPEAFVRLAAAARKKYPGARFTWIGSGSAAEMTAVKSYAERVVATGLAFTGWISDGELRAIMRSADIFVHYSAWDALPLAVTEAMAMGKPVLASPAVEQVLHGETGLTAADETELFDCFCRLADSGVLRNALGRNARKAAENNYNINKLVEKLADKYSGVAEKSDEIKRR